MKPSASPESPSRITPELKKGIIGIALTIGAAIGFMELKEKDPENEIILGIESVRDAVKDAIAGKNVEAERKIEEATIRWNVLAYRSEPDFEKGGKIGTFKKGTKLHIIEKRGWWLKVKKPESENETVWIWSGYLKKEEEIKAGKSVAITYGEKARGIAQIETIQRSAADEHFDFSMEEEARIRAYADERKTFKHGIDSINRTFDHRLIDHEILLANIMQKEGSTSSPGIVDLRKILFPHAEIKPIFIDIGPGLANPEAAKGGKGKPGITLQEIAAKFPDMPSIGIDLPYQINAFFGNKPEYLIDEDKQQEFLNRNNIHLISGNGLSRLSNLWKNENNNPVPNKKRPEITAQSTPIIRSANALDLYVSNRAAKVALSKIAEDYKSNAIMLLYNREIMVKPAQSTQWTIVGQTSGRGFQHFSRSLDLQKGELPYRLDAGKLNKMTEVYARTYGKSSEKLLENTPGGGSITSHGASLGLQE